MVVNKRAGAALLAALSAAFAVIGCSPNEPAGESGQGEANALTFSVISQTKYAPHAVPNEYTKRTEEKFGMKWDYQAIPLSAGMDKFNVMFASGEYPDFIPNMNQWNAVKKWAAAGYLLPIGDYFDKLPNYRKLYTDDQWSMLQQFTSVNGKVYMLPFISTTYDPMTWLYRKDVFDKAGIASFPKTTDELTEALQKLKDSHPGFIGIGVRGGSGNAPIKNLLYGFANTFRLPPDFNGANGWTGFWRDPDYNNEIVFAPATGKQRAMLQYLAELYKAGLIQKDFATATEDQFNQNRQNGKDVVHFQWVSQIVSLEKQNPNANWAYSTHYLQDSASPQPPVMFKGPDFALYGSLFSSKLASQPEKLEKLLQYVDWSATPEGLLFNQMGVENLTYVMKDGIPVYKDDLDRKKVLEQYGFDYYLAKSEEAQKGDPMYLITQEAAPHFKEMPTLYAEHAALNEQDTATVNTVMSGVWNEVYQFATKAVMGVVDINSDQVWQDHLQTLNKVGLDKAMAIYTKAMK